MSYMTHSNDVRGFPSDENNIKERKKGREEFYQIKIESAGLNNICIIDTKYKPFDKYIV